MRESMMRNLVSVYILMNKILILPIFFLTMCAPAPVTPPANAMEVEEELMWKALEYIQNYNTLQKQKTKPDEAINLSLIHISEPTRPY